MKAKSLLLTVVLGLVLVLALKGADLQAAAKLADTIRVHFLERGYR